MIPFELLYQLSKIGPSTHLLIYAWSWRHTSLASCRRQHSPPCWRAIQMFEEQLPDYCRGHPWASNQSGSGRDLLPGVGLLDESHIVSYNRICILVSISQKITVPIGRRRGFLLRRAGMPTVSKSAQRSSSPGLVGYSRMCGNQVLAE
jgi:hypothetical protein